MKVLKVTKGIIILLLLAVLVWASTTPPSGAVIEEHDSSESSSYLGTYQGHLLRQAQQFWLDEGDAQPVSGIGILLNASDYGDPIGDITLGIYDNAGGNIPGSLVSGSERSFSPVLGSWNYISYSAPGITLNTGSSNKYWIVASVPEQSGDGDAYRWHRSGSNTYDRGYRKTYNQGGSGTWSDSQPGDFAFRIYGDASLPVELVSFTGSILRHQVLLRWKTESEVNNLGFYVMRSGEDGIAFSPISSLIEGAGSTTQPQEYQFVDCRVQPDRSYWYRLKQVDFDGACGYFGPIEVYVPDFEEEPAQGYVPSKTELYANYPNPFNPRTSISFDLADEQRVIVSVYDLRGRLIRVLLNETVAGGHRTVEWNGTDGFDNVVPSGVYLCRMSCADGFVSMIRLVKVE